MEIQKGFLKRDVTTDECSWLSVDLKKGAFIYKYIKYTYNCISKNGIAVSDKPNKEPFYELPKDSIEWK